MSSTAHMCPESHRFMRVLYGVVDVILCRRCGYANPPASTFCESCKAFLEWEGEPTQPSPAEPAAVAPQLPRPTPVPSRPGSATHAISAQVVAPPPRLVPGRDANVELRVRNSGQTVDSYVVEPVGDAASWVRVEPAELPLFPGAEAVARVTFSPPRGPRPRAGQTSVEISVRSIDHPEIAVVEAIRVTIEPFVDLTAEFVPRTIRGRRSASGEVSLANAGNADAAVALEAVDPERVLAIEVPTPTLVVPPETSRSVPVVARVPGWKLVGDADRLPFEVRVRGGADEPILLTAAMERPGCLSRLAAQVATVLLLLTAVGVAYAISSPSPGPGPSPTPSGATGSPPAPAPEARLTNGGFNSGDWTGWTRNPDSGELIHITDLDAGIGPVVACCYARIDSGSSTDAWTTLSQEFDARAGDKIVGHALFRTEESRADHNDAGEVVILSPSGQPVATPFQADVAGVGPGGRTGWTAWSHTFVEAGHYQVVARARNVGDNTGTSYVALDEVALLPATAPASP